MPTRRRNPPVVTFGDDDPADGWDATDPPAEQLANLARRLAALTVVRAHRNRLAAIVADLEYVRARL